MEQGVGRMTFAIFCAHRLPESTFLQQLYSCIHVL